MPIGLVEEIQKAAIDPDVAVSTLLRRVKLAAVKLKLDTVQRWVELELDGYSGEPELPAYRTVGGSAMVRDAYTGWQPVALSEGTEFLQTATVGDSVGKIEALLAGKGDLIKQYPVNILESLSKHNGAQLLQGGCLISRSAFIGILDAVRNLTLDWVIELERAGILGDGLSFTAQERQQAREVHSTINVGTIHQMTGNLGVGITSGDITHAPLNIDKVKNLVSQIKSHASTLTNEGVDGDALARAIEAVEKHLTAEHPTLLRHALSELEKVVVKASGSLVAQGVLAVLHQILSTGVPVLS
jgi:hypothetical protein